jgi:hypothetical protein
VIDRAALRIQVSESLRRSAAIALVGPRQVGKTTLARALLDPRSYNWFDLEDPRVEAQLAQPMLALEPLDGFVVIDEVQRRPDLFPVLRVLIDRPASPARFLLLGSASPVLLCQSSEWLAGRIEVNEVPALTLDEVAADPRDAAALWWRGGFPRSLLAGSDEDSRVWRREFLRTTIERDLPQLGLAAPPPNRRAPWAAASPPCAVISTG